MPLLTFLFADLTPVSAVSLSVALYAAVSAPYFLLVDAECWVWPRPLVAAVERVSAAAWSGRLDPLLQVVSHAKHDAREMAALVREFVAGARSYARLSLRDAAITAAALLMLLRQNPETLR